jgi:predicted metal-dependent hydrolase
MNTQTDFIEVRGIKVEVIRKAVKNFHLAVYPPDGQVRATSPYHYDNDAVRLAVVSRFPWIQKQQKAFQAQSRQPPRQMITGETHYFKGHRYRLDVIETNATHGVRLINNKKIQLKIKPGTHQQKKKEILYEWYRKQLKAEIPAMLAKWGPIMGLTINEVKVRIMKTRWGSCNIEAKRIWLNLELAKKPRACMEYIMVHEMTHVFERHHTERFRELMDHFMPDWRLRRDKLNEAPLSHEEWTY